MNSNLGSCFCTCSEVLSEYSVWEMIMSRPLAFIFLIVFFGFVIFLLSFSTMGKWEFD